MCGDNGCNCLGDVYDLQDEIKKLNNKLDDLTDEIKYLKEDMRSINKGTHKALKKWIEEDEFNLEQYLDDKIKEANKERSIRLAEAKAANNLGDLIKSDIVLDTVFYYDGMLEALKEVKEKVRNV